MRNDTRYEDIKIEAQRHGWLCEVGGLWTKCWTFVVGEKMTLFFRSDIDGGIELCKCFYLTNKYDVDLTQYKEFWHVLAYPPLEPSNISPKMVKYRGNVRATYYTDASNFTFMDKKYTGYGFVKVNGFKEEYNKVLVSDRDNISRGETMAILLAVRDAFKCGVESNVNIVSDSMDAITDICFSGWTQMKSRKRYEGRNADLVREILSLIILGNFNFYHVLSHAGVRFNERIDSLVKSLNYKPIAITSQSVS